MSFKALGRLAVAATVVVIASLALVASAHAQGNTADIVGRVTDSSGGALPGTTVTVTHQATGTVRTLTTNESGDFVANALPIGGYAIRIELEGFKAYASNVTVSAGDRLRVDASLEVGALTETVQVEGAAPALQTDSSAVQEVVTAKAVQDLPLNGRNYVNLVQMSAGANPGPPNGLSSGNRPDDRRQTSTVSVNGQSDVYNNYLIDGLDNNERQQGTQAIRPSIDAIAEVRVLTNLFSAELGRTAGAVVNVITKSGSNAFKGSGYEFFRDDKFDSRDFFAIKKPDFRQNQFGGSLGGPIIRNKTFFFGDVEWLKATQGVARTVTVPTDANRAGVFTTTITDPVTGLPFPGNTIPGDRMSPIALRYLGLIPSPNLPGTAANYQTIRERTYDSFTTDVKVEHRLTDSDSLFVRYSYNPVDVFSPGALPVATVLGKEIDPGGVSGGFPGPSEMAGHGFHANYQRIMGSALLLEAKGGFSKIALNSYPLNYGQALSDTFGVPGANVSSLPFSSGLTPMNISGYVQVGDDIFLPIVNTNRTYQYNAALTYTRSAHNIKVGGALIRRHLERNANGYPRGLMSFAPAPTGNAFASFLLGLPQTVQRENTVAYQKMRTWEMGGFIQDDWRATNWLTLNLGVRYDIFTPFTEVDGNYANLNLETAKLVLGTDDPHVGVKQDNNNIAPRLGFSATVSPTMVVRGGFGITYFPADFQQATIQLPNQPYVYTYTPNPLTVTLAQGFPTPAASDPNNLRGTVNAKSFDIDTASLRQFNLIVQKDFWGNVISVGYVGSRGRNLIQVIPNFNVPVPSAAAGPATRRPYITQLPNVTTIRAAFDTGKSEYNSLQTTFQRRLRSGLVVNANYTLAKMLDNVATLSGGTNPYGLIPTQVETYDWGRSELDIRHRVAFSANYELPFGKDASGATRALIHGWQVNMVGYWQSGLPFTVASSVTRINTTATSDRPNMIKDPVLSAPTILQWFDTTAFAAQTLGTAGDEPRNALEGPAQRRLDFSVFKSFSIGATGSLQLRVEVFNLTNTANFANPVNTIAGYDANGVPLTANGFGRITSTAINNVPRQMQFGIKYLF